MTQIVLPKLHPIFEYCGDIRTICKPLKIFFEISHFAYVKIFPDMSRIHLDTDPEWAKQFYLNAHLYYQQGGCTEARHWSNSWSILHQLPEDQCIIDAAQFGIGNGIVISQHGQGITELFFLALSCENDNGKNVFRLIHNYDLLLKFTDYFKDNAKKIIRTSRKHPISLNFIEPTNEVNPLRDEQNIRNGFLAALNANGATTSIITNKQKTCASYLLQGSSNADIAEKMHISVRTVEKHIASLRRCFGCRNIIDLLAKLHRYRFLIS